MATWFDRILDSLGFTRTAVVDENAEELEKAVEILRKEYGPMARVRGFSSYKEFFRELKISKAKRLPYKWVFIHESKKAAGPIILEKTEPSIQAVKYSDTQNLSKHLPVLS